jgi:hypothetical protein
VHYKCLPFAVVDKPLFHKMTHETHFAPTMNVQHTKL